MTDKVPNKRRGPSREQAMANLAKAHAASKRKRETLKAANVTKSSTCNMPPNMSSCNMTDMYMESQGDMTPPSKNMSVTKGAKDMTDMYMTDMYGDMSAYMSGDMSASRDIDKKTCRAITYHLGRHVQRLLEQSSKDTILKNSYAVKSLADSYQNYLKMLYPSGMDTSQNNHLTHLLGSILPSIQKSLTVNIHVSPPPQEESGKESHDCIDVTPREGGVR